jgi:structural maintenance of chromosome 3 (chondroitin sulfate proteoglycan 6)
VQLGNQKRLLEIERNEDLLRRQEDLQDFLGAGNLDLSGTGSQEGNVDAWREELRTLQATITELQETVDSKLTWPREKKTRTTSETLFIIATEQEMDRINRNVAGNSTRLDKLQSEQLKNSRGILQAQKTAERYIIKRQTLLNRREECNKSVRDLGVLPEEAFHKYTNEAQVEKVSSFNIAAIVQC